MAYVFLGVYWLICTLAVVVVIVVAFLFVNALVEGRRDRLRDEKLAAFKASPEGQLKAIKMWWPSHLFRDRH